MIKNKPLSIWLGLFLCGWMVLPAAAQADELPSRLIVHFKAAVSAAEGNRVLLAAVAPSAQVASRPDGLESGAVTGGRGVVEFADPQVTAWLLAQPEVAEVEPDVLLTHQGIYPNDQHLNDQWALVDYTTGIRAPDAWEKSTGSGVVIAVVDTGYLPHKDLIANLLPGYDMISSASIAADGNGRDANALDQGDYALTGECGSSSPAHPSSWHGTHVSGIAAASANNGIGVAGVAYDARILPVRALGKCGGYTSDIADAVVWASGGQVAGVPGNAHPAKVINLSLGGASPCRRTLQTAIDTARANGSTVVVAAGNSSTDASSFSPANCAGVVTVAATARNGARAPYSNYGNTVDLAAPGGGGVGILSTLNSGQQTAKADSYRTYQGTSMATPHVAGAAALLLSARPSLLPDAVEEALKAAVRPTPGVCDGCGTGLLDVSALFGGDMTPPTPSPMRWGNDAVTADRFSVRVQSTTALDSSGKVEYWFDCSLPACGSWQSANSLLVNGLAPGGNVRFRVKARDGFANETAWSDWLDAATLLNHRPAALDDGFEVSGEMILDVLQNDVDSDGDTLQVQSVTTPGHGSAGVVAGKVVYTPVAGFAGEDRFGYTVTDGFDSGSADIVVTVSATSTGSGGGDGIPPPPSVPDSAPKLAGSGGGGGFDLGFGLLLSALVVLARKRLGWSIR